MLEPCEGKLSCTVLRGEGGSNTADLLDRPGDLAQRKGRIERQGNQNPLVHVYRYVTEGTFDAYLWQTVENKQKFISQIMTSKSPVRSCDDVDETALSFAEIKALCAGDPRIKERMDLDVEVSRLKLMKADHQSKQYRLEDQLLKHFPEEIEKHKGFIQGLETDMETLAAHPHPTDGFTGMEVRGDTLTDKENAGAALLDACKEVKGSEPVQVGSYRGFAMFVTFDAFQKEYMLQLKGRMTHRTALGADPRGNLTRIDNALSQMPQRLESVKIQLDNLYQQQAAAKEEVGKAFPYEEELRVKNARLVELDMELNMDSKGQSRPEAAIAKRERPSVLEGLKRPIPPRSMEKKPRQQDKVNPGLTDLFLKQARKVLQAPEELALIEQKMAQLGTVNREAYLRKMALDGYVVKLDLPELKELVSLMRYSSDNLNQLTRKVHETGRVYDADLEDISQRQEQLWEGVQKILAQLSKLS